MGQLKDLTGQKFGKLTVLRRVEDRKRGRPMWLCQCECGNQTVVSSTRLLLPNGTRSCGCLRHQPSNNLVDLTGKVFGHLTVDVEFDGFGVKGSAVVEFDALTELEGIA